MANAQSSKQTITKYTTGLQPLHPTHPRNRLSLNQLMPQIKTPMNRWRHPKMRRHNQLCRARWGQRNSWNFLRSPLKRNQPKRVQFPQKDDLHHSLQPQFLKGPFRIHPRMKDQSLRPLIEDPRIPEGMSTEWASKEMTQIILNQWIPLPQH